MGYTHYWEIRPEDNAGWERGLADCGRIIRASRGILAGPGRTGRPECGDGVAFNGRGENGHEDFTLPANPIDGATKFEFCKTARKPYDSVVTACLAVMALRAPGAIRVHSDGDADEWAGGLALAERVIGERVHYPCERGE